MPTAPRSIACTFTGIVHTLSRTLFSAGGVEEGALVLVCTTDQQQTHELAVAEAAPRRQRFVVPPHNPAEGFALHLCFGHIDFCVVLIVVFSKSGRARDTGGGHKTEVGEGLFSATLGIAIVGDFIQSQPR